MTKKRKKHAHKMLLAAFTVAASILSAYALTRKDDGHFVEEDRIKYYTSVYVTRDMTLWGISEKFITSEYTDIWEYMDEVRDINHLPSDELQYGEYICVPYYSSEYKD